MTLCLVCLRSVGVDLEGPVWTITLGLRPQAVIKRRPSAKRQAPITLLPNTKKTLQEKEKRREAPGQDFNRTMTEDNNICLECKKTTKDVDCEGNQTF